VYHVSTVVNVILIICLFQLNPGKGASGKEGVRVGQRTRYDIFLYLDVNC